MIVIDPYKPSMQQLWDEAVAASRNGIFQHYRAYMDYHSDRFVDCSVLARDQRGRVLAVLPAHAVGREVCSHRGLSFGGWLMSARADVNVMDEVWNAMTEHYRARGFTSMYYRPSPHVYHTYPAEEDLYALFRAGGQLVGCQVSAVVDMSAPLGYDSNARRAVRRAEAAALACGPSGDLASFWVMLENCLAERHDAKPVHTLAEMELLQGRFPGNICLYSAYDEHGQMVAGVLMYYTRTDAHCQYIASDSRGRELGALPALFSFVMDDARRRGIRWFDFGTSCEDGGRILNSGLARQKCGFGGRAVVYNAYSIPL